MRFEKIFRHGDVIIFKLDEKTLEGKEFKSTQMKEFVLEEGEMTGHAHRLGGDFEVFEHQENDSEFIFKVNNRGFITHEEHDLIVLEEGYYLKTSQVEYNPFEDLIVKVLD